MIVLFGTSANQWAFFLTYAQLNIKLLCGKPSETLMAYIDIRRNTTKKEEQKILWILKFSEVCGMITN